jgi:hypothetical protein
MTSRKDRERMRPKLAGFLDTLRAAKVPDMLAQAAIGAGTSAAVGAGIAGIGVAAAHIHDAATKRRDFVRMMDMNADLHDAHARDPKLFAQMYSSLRRFNPAFAKDPLVAGTFLRRMSESVVPGGVLTEALSMRDRVPDPGAMVLRQALEGAKSRMHAAESDEKPARAS